MAKNNKMTVAQAYRAAKKSTAAKPNIDIPKPIKDAGKAVGKGAKAAAKGIGKGAKVVGKSVAKRGIIPLPPSVKVAAIIGLAAGEQILKGKEKAKKDKLLKQKIKETRAARAKDEKANKARQAINSKYDKKK